MFKSLSKSDLRALAAQAVKDATITKIPTGRKALDLTEKEWAQTVRGDFHPMSDEIRAERRAENEAQERYEDSLRRCGVIA